MCGGCSHPHHIPRLNIAVRWRHAARHRALRACTYARRWRGRWRWRWWSRKRRWKNELMVLVMTQRESVRTKRRKRMIIMSFYVECVLDEDVKLPWETRCEESKDRCGMRRRWMSIWWMTSE